MSCDNVCMHGLYCLYYTLCVCVLSISVTEIYCLGIMVLGLVSMIQGLSVFFVISRNGAKKLA